ncbi:oligosaccharide flippase family protein, partial [bacterium]|nr:oligosaccharide flippase family protein [bacterium]
MGTRKNNFFGGVIIEGMAMIITILLGIVVTPIYFQYITTNEFGVWSTILELMTLMTLLNAGVGLLIVQTISNLSKKGVEYVRKNLSSLLFYQVFILIIMLLVCIVAYYILPIFRSYELSNDLKFNIYMIMVVYLLTNTFSSWLNFVMVGRNQIVLSNSIASLQKISNQLLPILFMFLGLGVISFSYSYITISFLGLCIYIIFCSSYLKDKISSNYVSKFAIKENTRFSFRMFLGGTGYYIFNFTDTLVIANFLSGHFVTVYVLTMKLGNVTRFVSAKILSSAFPSIAQLIAEENYEKLHEVILKLFRVAFRIAIFVPLFIFLFNETFVTNWVGFDKFGGNLISLFSAIICFREAIFPVFGSVIFSTKDIKTFNYILLFEAGTNILMSIILVRTWGIAGVAFATVLSSCVFSLGYSWHKASQIIRLEIWQYFPSMLTVFLKSLPSIIVLVFGLIILKNRFGWLLFIVILTVAGFINVLFFEGSIIIKHRKLHIKDI